MSNRNMTELTATELIELVNNMHITNDEENTEMVVINYNELIRIVSMYEDRLKYKDNQIKNLSELQSRGSFRVAELSVKNECLKNENERQKAEIEQLTKYCGMFERGEIGSPITTDKMLVLEKEKIELQEQIDELKQEKLNAVCDLNMRVIELDNELKQAVKDTAKEIYKKGKKLDKDFDMTGLGEYILANFLTDVNSVEVE